MIWARMLGYITGTLERIEKQPTTKGDYQKRRKARDREQYFVQQSHEPIFARVPRQNWSPP
jgi:hypothetical protein